MAHYRMMIAEKKQDAVYIFVDMDDVWYDPDNHWTVGPNSWVGSHSGTYTFDPCFKKIHFFADGEEVMVFDQIMYPDDCRERPYTDMKSGPGSYASFAPLAVLPLTWATYPPPDF